MFSTTFSPFCFPFKGAKEFYALWKAENMYPVFVLPFKPMGDFPQIFAGFLPHRQPTPKRRQVWSWILFAVPTGWSLSFPALCASLHLSHGLYPTSLWRTGLYHQETHLLRNGEKWRLDPFLSFFFGGCFGRKRILFSFWGASFFFGNGVSEGWAK